MNISNTTRRNIKVIKNIERARFKGHLYKSGYAKTKSDNDAGISLAKSVCKSLVNTLGRIISAAGKSKQGGK